GRPGRRGAVRGTLSVSTPLAAPRALLRVAEQGRLIGGRCLTLSARPFRRGTGTGGVRGARRDAELARLLILLVAINCDPPPALALGRLAGGVAARERVQHEVAGVGQEADEEQRHQLGKAGGVRLAARLLAPAQVVAV